jgi:hypothetical protein
VKLDVGCLDPPPGGPVELSVEHVEHDPIQNLRRKSGALTTTRGSPPSGMSS